MEEQGSLRWVHELAWSKGLYKGEFRRILRHQYGTPHVRKLTAEQLYNVEQLLNALPNVEKQPVEQTEGK